MQWKTGKSTDVVFRITEEEIDLIKTIDKKGIVFYLFKIKIILSLINKRIIQVDQMHGFHIVASFTKFGQYLVKEKILL